MSTIRTDTLQNVAASLSVPVATVVQGSAKAWVNFDGVTATPTIRASFNVSSITDNGTGDYTVNFTTAMPDANYSAQVTSQLESNGSNWTTSTLWVAGNPFAAGSVRVGQNPTGGGGGGARDSDYYCVTIFR
jgi:hypothetical protein